MNHVIRGMRTFASLCFPTLQQFFSDEGGRKDDDGAIKQTRQRAANEKQSKTEEEQSFFVVLWSVSLLLLSVEGPLTADGDCRTHTAWSSSYSTVLRFLLPYCVMKLMQLRTMTGTSVSVSCCSLSVSPPLLAASWMAPHQPAKSNFLSPSMYKVLNKKNPKE